MKPIHLFALLPAAFLVAPAAYPAPPAAPAQAAPDYKALYNRAIDLATKKKDIAGAIALCRQIVAKVPTAAPVWATMARLLSQQGHNADAVAAATKAVSLAPQTPAFRADLADYYLRSGNRVKAESLAQSVLKSAPKNDVALSVLTTLRLTARNYKEAIPLLNRLQAVRGGKDRAVAQNQVATYMQLRDIKGALRAAQAYSQNAPKDAEAMLAVLDFALATKNAPVANAYITKLAKVAPASPLPAFYQGQVTMLNDSIPLETRFATAEKSYQKAVDVAPEEASFRRMLAIAQLGQANKRKWNDARSNFTAAILYDNHDDKARFGLARLDEEEQLWDDAAVQYEAYLQIRPNEIDQRRRYAGVLLNAGRKTEAYAQFAALAARQPNDTLYLKELASYLLRDKSYKEAREAYTQILERDPKDKDADLGIAQTYAGENQPRLARVAYDRAIVADPQREDNYLLLAELYLSNGESESGVETLERALKANPNANRARWLLIEQYIAAKRDDDARREIAKLTLKDAGDNRNLYRLVGGNLYMAREKYPEAIAEFERIEREERDNPVVLLALAGAYTKGGRQDDAQKTYERAATTAERLLLLPHLRKNQGLRDALIKARTALKQPERATEFIKNIDSAE